MICWGGGLRICSSCDGLGCLVTRGGRDEEEEARGGLIITWEGGGEGDGGVKIGGEGCSSEGEVRGREIGGGSLNG